MKSQVEQMYSNQYANAKPAFQITKVQVGLE